MVAKQKSVVVLYLAALGQTGPTTELHNPIWQMMMLLGIFLKTWTKACEKLDKPKYQKLGHAYPGRCILGSSLEM